MANATFEVLEFRAVVKPEFTELYILTSQASDGTLGVGGWFKKTIPPSKAALDELRDALVKCSYLVEWDRGAPPDQPTTGHHHVRPVV